MAINLGKVTRFAKSMQWVWALGFESIIFSSPVQHRIRDRSFEYISYL